MPDCAAGHDRTYPVEVLASHPQQCVILTRQGPGAAPQAAEAYVYRDIRGRLLDGGSAESLAGLPYLSNAAVRVAAQARRQVPRPSRPARRTCTRLSRGLTP